MDSLLLIAEEELDEPIGLIDCILQANRDSLSLDVLRAQASMDEPSDFKLEDSLLLYTG
jgi:hypothetical protein